MKTMTASNAQNNFGDLLDTVRREPVLLTKNKRQVGAFVSLEDLQGTYLVDLLSEKESGYDEWSQAEVGRSLARLRQNGSDAADVYGDTLDKIRRNLHKH